MTKTPDGMSDQDWQKALALVRKELSRFNGDAERTAKWMRNIGIGGIRQCRWLVSAATEGN